MGKSQSQLEAELEAIEKKLSTGVSEVTTNGTKTVLDLAALERRAKVLRSQISSTRAKRPPASSINLGGF